MSQSASAAPWDPFEDPAMASATSAFACYARIDMGLNPRILLPGQSRNGPDGSPFCMIQLPQLIPFRRKIIIAIPKKEA